MLLHVTLSGPQGTPMLLEWGGVNPPTGQLLRVRGRGRARGGGGGAGADPRWREPRRRNVCLSDRTARGPRTRPKCKMSEIPHFSQNPINSAQFAPIWAKGAHERLMPPRAAPLAGLCAVFPAIGGEGRARWRNRAHWRKSCQFSEISPFSPKSAQSRPGWLKQASSAKNSYGFCGCGRKSDFLAKT